MSEQKKDLSPAGPPVSRPKVPHCSNDSFTLSTFTRLFLFQASRVTIVQVCSTMAHRQSVTPQSVRQDSVQTKPSYLLRSLQIGFARTCVLFYLQLTILCAEPPCCGHHVLPADQVLSGFINIMMSTATSCQGQQKRRNSCTGLRRGN